MKTVWNADHFFPAALNSDKFVVSLVHELESDNAISAFAAIGASLLLASAVTL